MYKVLKSPLRYRQATPCFRLNTVIPWFLQRMDSLSLYSQRKKRQSLALVREKRAEAKAKKAKKSVNEEDSQTHIIREMEINV